jgi:hypothetical protein
MKTIAWSRATSSDSLCFEGRHYSEPIFGTPSNYGIKRLMSKLPNQVAPTKPASPITRALNVLFGYVQPLHSCLLS